MGNYVVQYLLEIVDRETFSEALWTAVRGNVIKLSCNKFASNVIEKCLQHVTGSIQREMLMEIYGAGPEAISDMFQNSFGNYIMQSSIGLANPMSLLLIDEKLRRLLPNIPYGGKIAQRLDRRLVGEPAASRKMKMPARR